MPADSPPTQTTPVGLSHAQVAGRSAAGQTKRSRTRDQILTAAESLLASRDYNTLTVSEMAKTAGVGMATFYLAFPHKDAVIAELFNLRVQGQAVPVTSGRDLGADALEDYLCRLGSASRAMSSISRAYLVALVTTTFGQALRGDVEALETVPAYLTRLIDVTRGRSDRILAIGVLVVLLGAVLLEPNRKVEEVAAVCVKLLAEDVNRPS